MTAQLLAGGPVAEAVLDDVRNRVEALAARGVTPGLGTILVGDDGASAGYVRKKHETCESVGFASQHISVAASASPTALDEAVAAFNEDPSVHGYIIQHPVPAGFDFNAALSAMDPGKDADGLHPTNLGRLVLQENGPVPCTPAGIQAIFVHYGIEVSGRHVVVIGRGPTLGRPLALLLTTKAPGANAAVTVVHSAVPNLADHTRKADIVVAAVGIPGFVTPDMVKPGAVVVSGGITWEGRKVLADVDESVGEVASWITPRLGGVGPTTVAMLLRNTVEAAERTLA
ncbi:MAG: tetrahydrofolate dehydrogenase/cyclohydrolase catalytic domain-containing protein [Acidimicrobiales bacterium]|jgi:methylenetetrahydrofolate dehydrogenase (NADP+)/methenyltetrahydrofolate cyclohydrolase|nr:tetrahydrofolate dehydrogenase/cyclohydrolase catalytic domain-containing protein [Acidimicrobiales bacterium]MDP6239765.1 tetrahydrofolate dehydrogenase/cyclohydrolase catalytic domain-containing protein [Acidimicrobiales bacterium]MDP6493065.1 tetrahydrofolate dehydrogenase/cyclohydrolase catalytic domain-containing protein [Acidimicrobiales bacterium]MDP6759313.1 tetrahydrofolate dehydrogenase/cyclohydrolase catalytic domain-containing protein [Acidimicrobiales bacterium]MDP7124884.1 tetr|tara:strand:- start:10586 stop:11443 length:858 start_codon:yes stop_codon:yes gene_type:complete